MSLRLSKQEVAIRAIELAKERIAAMPTKGWEWECKEAFPHLLDPSDGDRKIPRKWVVSVMWSKDGTLFDGPSVIIVDVESGTTQVVDTP
jgi:hypothetical protein